MKNEKGHKERKEVKKNSTARKLGVCLLDAVVCHLHQKKKKKSQTVNYTLSDIPFGKNVAKCVSGTCYVYNPRALFPPVWLPLRVYPVSPPSPPPPPGSSPGRRLFPALYACCSPSSEVEAEHVWSSGIHRSSQLTNSTPFTVGTKPLPDPIQPPRVKKIPCWRFIHYAIS